MTATTDVVIVGAGPTGLTLAARLQQFDASVRIIDRQLDRVHESRALAVQPRTLEVLRGLGIAETLVERGNDAVQLRIHFGERIVSVRLFDIGLGHRLPVPALHLAGRDGGDPERASRGARRAGRARRRARRLLGGQ